MPVTLVTGKLGAGKSLVCVGRIRDYLRQGRRVATNLDLHLDKLLPAQSRASVVRLPDKPTVRDLEVLGSGNDLMDESRNGLIVLDELAAWLNARSWGDKSRQPVIDWLIHSRKKGWDVMLICQHMNQIDKQVREALVEYLVLCRRLDRMRIPFFGPLVSLLTGGLVKGYFPKMHFGIVRYGTAADSVVAERWFYQGRDLWKGYNTRQVFSDAYIVGPQAKEGAAGAFSYLSAWHLVGRYRGTLWQRLCAWWSGPERDRQARRRRPPAPRLRPLLDLPPEARIRAARRLLELGAL